MLLLLLLTRTSRLIAASLGGVGRAGTLEVVGRCRFLESVAAVLVLLVLLVRVLACST